MDRTLRGQQLHRVRNQLTDVLVADRSRTQQPIFATRALLKCALLGVSGFAPTWSKYELDDTDPALPTMNPE